MTKPRQGTKAIQEAQMSIAFTTRRPLEAEQRVAAVKLLSQLLLQVATAERGNEVPDDHA